MPLRDRPLFYNSSEEESNESGLVKGGVKGGLVECTEFEVKQTPYGSVHRPCGLKQDGKREALSQLREEQKRRRGGRQTKMIQRMSLIQYSIQKYPCVFFALVLLSYSCKMGNTIHCPFQLLTLQ